MALRKTETILSQHLKLNIHDIISNCSHKLKKSTPYLYVKNLNYQSFNSLSIKDKNINNLYLRLNDKISNETMDNFKNHTIWSIRYLNTVADMKNQMLENTILMNPYKSYELIEKSLTKGLSWMLVRDIDQFQKIHQIKFELQKKLLRQIQVNCIWEFDTFKQTKEELSLLNKHGLQIQGLSLNYDNKLLQQFEELGKYCESIGNLIQKKIVQINMSTTDLNTFHFSNDMIYELINYNETDNYIILCRVIGKDRKGNFIVSQEAQRVISNQNLQKSQVLTVNGFQWVICKPNSLQINENNMLAM